MNDSHLQLKSSPIVEAVLDIDCDLPPSSDVQALEVAAQERLRDAYPIPRKRFVQEMQFEAKDGEAPRMSARHGLQALQFLARDEKQLMQLRPQGYSFNRLAPYTSLDDYLPEIERIWNLFVELTAPVQVRLIRLRFINRILLPRDNGIVDLDQYLKLGPRLPDEANLSFSGFFNQHSAIELATGNAVNITMATQPLEGDKLPVILDIEASHVANIEPTDWAQIATRIQSLRRLKNLVFKNTLTGPCLNLFQH
jgi:uncharacterized protein (TIGR04255 family)